MDFIVIQFMKYFENDLFKSLISIKMQRYISFQSNLYVFYSEPRYANKNFFCGTFR